MNRQQFMKDLKRYLKKAHPQDVQDALEFYEELFDDAGLRPDDTVPESYGTPKQIALEILAEKTLNDDPKDNPKRMVPLWAIFVAIFAFPIGIPLIIATLAAIFALVVASVAVAIGFFAVAASLVYVMFMPGVTGAFQVMAIGAILFSFAIAALLFKLVAAILRGIWRKISQMILDHKEKKERASRESQEHDPVFRPNAQRRSAASQPSQGFSANHSNPDPEYYDPEEKWQ